MDRFNLSSLINNSSDPWAVMDVNRTVDVINYNKPLRELFEYQDDDEDTINSVLISKLTTTLKENNISVSNYNFSRTIVKLETYPVKKDWSVSFFHYHPLADEHKDARLVLIQITPAFISNVNKVVLQKESFKCKRLSISSVPPSDMFSEVEWRTIFLLKCGKSQKEISAIENISLKAVEKRVSRCLDKTDCSNVRELLIFIDENDWDLYIPSSFFKKNG